MEYIKSLMTNACSFVWLLFDNVIRINLLILSISRFCIQCNLVFSFLLFFFFWGGEDFSLIKL